MITQERLKQLFTYKDGKLFWINSPRANVKKGSEAGWTDSLGYINIMIDTKSYKAHRLIFLYHKGYLPELLDHKYRIPSDNEIDNLRPATAAQNQQNAKIRTDNTSGVKGVGWHKKTGKWSARISLNGIRLNIGLFNTIKEASDVITKKRFELHGDFCNHGEKI